MPVDDNIDIVVEKDRRTGGIGRAASRLRSSPRESLGAKAER